MLLTCSRGEVVGGQVLSGTGVAEGPWVVSGHCEEVVEGSIHLP